MFSMPGEESCRSQGTDWEGTLEAWAKEKIYRHQGTGLGRCSAHIGWRGKSLGIKAWVLEGYLDQQAAWGNLSELKDGSGGALWIHRLQKEICRNRRRVWEAALDS